MTRTTRSLTGLVASCCLLVSSLAQQPISSAPPPAQTTDKIKSNEVLLDVVVHDKKGRPVRDLKPEEIEIYEDGVKQTATKFTLVGKGAAEQSKPASQEPEKAAGPAAAQANQPAPLNLVTMVFDHLTVQRVQAVRTAALNFIDNSLTDDMHVRIMVIGRRLYVIEQFTNDRAKLRRAVDRATGTVEKSFAEQSNRIADELRTIAADTSPLSAISESVYSPPSNEAMLAKLTLDSLTASEKMSQEVKSNLHVFSLLPFARAHRLMPGRKMALYFSDGLYMPQGMGEALKSAISEANRANLSFYAINIRNLVVGAGNQVSRLESSTVINQTRRPESSTFNNAFADSFSVSDRYPGRTQITSNFSMFEVTDRNKEINKLGPLAELTESTGGFQITNVNDLNGALKRVASDLGNYYSVSYQPTKQEYDGKFRSISVKVLRSGVKAQTRSGYFSLPPSTVKRPELSFEAPLLAALNDPVVPRDFPFQAGALHFESRQNEVHCALVIDLPLNNFIHQEDKEKKIYTMKFAVLGMVKDEKGEVVQRFSEPHQFEIPSANVEAIKQSGFTMTRHFWLEPGRYTLETAAHDQSNGKISAQRLVFNVAKPSTGLQTGSLFLVKQVEQMDGSANADIDNPLISGEQKIIPEMEQNISTNGRTDLSFHLAIFPDSKTSEKPSLKLELLLDGKVIAATSPALPDPDDKGRITFTAGIPASGFASGKHRFRALVTQAGVTSEEAIDFTIIGGRAKEEPVAEEKVITSSLAAADKVGELTISALKTVKPIELSPTELLGEIEKSGSQIYGKLGEYTYSLRKVRRVLNPKGKIKSEEYQDYEAYPVKGKHALIQLAENGSRLAVTRIDINRRHATDILIKSEVEAQKQSAEDLAQKIGYWGASLEGIAEKKGQPRRNVFITIDPESFFRAGEFSAPRGVLLEGRETIVMDFRPRAGAKLGQDQEWIQRLAGTVWIDAADKSLVRIEGQSAPSEGVKSEAVETPLNFVYQQQRLAAGIWAPSLIRINSGGDETLFRGLNWDAWFEFTNFKRFDSRDSDVKIVSPDEKKQ